IVPTVPHLAEAVREATASWPVVPRIIVDPAEKDAAFRTARAALAKSGTVTLELALAHVPTIAAYRLGLIEEAIVRVALGDKAGLFDVRSVILPNLIANQGIIPEILQREGTPERLAAALAPLLRDSP